MQQQAVSSAQRVGADLRAARERLGWSLADTSAYVRIRLPFLQALEDGRVADLPGQAYALGFVRTYARALGMDAEELVRRYHADIGDALPAAELNFPTPIRQHHVPAGAVVMLGAALAIVGYATWYGNSADRAVPVPVQQVPARLAPLALPPVPPPARTAAATQTPSPVTTTRLATVSVPSSPSAAEASVPAPGSLAPIEPAPIVPTSPPPPNQIVLGATADAWVQVKDAQGHIVLSKLMHAGDSWAVPAATGAPLLLTTGNAGGTTLSVNGQLLPALGGNGVVKREVALDPDSLRNASTTAGNG